MVEVKPYETLSNNKLLNGLSEEDYNTVMEYYQQKFPIYYVLKERFKLELKLEKFESGDYYILINPMCRKDIFDGKIDTIKNLSIPNEKFLNHMFRYNQTLKAFSTILERGKFDVTNQYELKDIWNYFKDIHFSYTQKGEKYIGHMDTKTKLDFFPTAYEFQYASLMSVTNVKKKFEDHIRKSTLKFIETNLGTTYINIDANTYKELIKMGRFDIIDEVFRVHIKNNDESDGKIVIADLFAGEGEWLNLFKKMAYYSDTYLIANEIERNRFMKCKEKKFHMSINKAYEELEVDIPKNFINILLFNPPYGVTDGERNVQRFFKMLLKDKYLNEYSSVIFVLNSDDYEFIFKDLINNFMITEKPFRITGNEGERLDQICVIGRKLFSERNFVDVSGKFEEFIEEANKSNSFDNYFENLIENNKRPYYGLQNVTRCFDNHKVKMNPEMYLSKADSDCWNSLINSVSIDTFQGKRIKLAERPRDIGAAANLISSGLINGEIEGQHEHCIAAGISEQESRQIDESGNVVVLRKSAPFLSVLTGGNIVEITKIKNEDNVIIEDDGTVVVN